jgi:hypothetical protein
MEKKINQASALPTTLSACQKLIRLLLKIHDDYFNHYFDVQEVSTNGRQPK